MGVAIADLCRGFRILRRNPGFAAIAIATLGLGIGLNCAAFTLVNTLLLHSPPYAQAERIVELREKNAARGLTQQLVSVPDYWDWRGSNRTFENIAAWNFQYFNLTGADEPERVEGLTVTPDYFSVLRIHPALGRDFLPEDEQPGNTHVAILSDSLWRRRFGMDRSVIGRTVAIEDEPYMVVGVLPGDFRLFRVLNRDLDLFVPQTLHPSHASRADHLLFVYGRLRPGISIEQARSQMEATAAALARQHPETNTGWTVEVQELHRQWTAQSRPTFLLLQGAAGFVLLIACANLAGMLLARALWNGNGRWRSASHWARDGFASCGSCWRRTSRSRCSAALRGLE